MRSTTFATLALIGALQLPAAFAQSSGADAFVETLGGGSVGAPGVPLLEYRGAPVLGRPFALRVTNALPGSWAIIGAGLNGSPVSLPQFGAVQHVGLPLVGLQFGAIDANGVGETSLGVPVVDPVLSGLSFFVQGFVFDIAAQGSLAFTPALRIGFGRARERDHVFGMRMSRVSPPKSPNSQGLPSISHRTRFVDVDGDQRLDAVTPVDREIWVAMGTGDGAFEDPAVRALGSPVIKDLAVGDVNGDGVVDLVVASGSSEIFLGAGDGTFSPSTGLVPGSSMHEPMQLADLDGDGFDDIVTVWDTQRTVSVWMNQGDGTFTGPSTSVGAESRSEFGIVDVDNDAVLDLVLPDWSLAKVVVRLGVGDGTFEAATDSPVALTPRELAFGDFDSDGLVDLAAVTTYSSFVKVFKGGGDGSFAPLETIVTSGVALKNLTGYDVNADGIDDLVAQGPQGTTAIEKSERVVTLICDGSGNFAVGSTTYIPKGSEAFTLDDANGDSIPDLLTSTPSGSSTVIDGLGLGEFEAVGGPLESRLAFRQWLFDLNSDGLLDLTRVFNDFQLPRIEIAHGRPGGQFDPPTVLTFPGTWSISALHAADVDGDGLIDLVVGFARVNDLRVLPGMADGTFGTAWLLPIYVPPLVDPIDFAFPDLNGDSVPDLVAALFQDVVVRMGLGGGNFGPPLPKSLGVFPDGVGVTALDVTDINDDGVLDLAVSTWASQQVVMMLGNGDGTFGANQYFPADNSSQRGARTAFGDFDWDGHTDMAVLTVNAVAVFRGAGGGTFHPAVHYEVSSPEPVTSLEWLDIDGDGIRDLVFADESIALCVLFGDASGGFGSLTRFWMGPSQYPTPRYADLNGDGMVDGVAVGLILNALYF